jgi:hypothetical protein
MNMPAGMPAYSVLAEALRTTTERLAREVAAPAPLPPDWSPLQWDVARAAATMQGIAVLLAHRLRWRGPDSWQNFLANQRHHAIQRDARIESRLARLGQALHDARVGCLALKGSSLRRLGLYRPGERPMGDIDLLALDRDSSRVGRALDSMGYECIADMRRHRIFAPREARSALRAGEHPDNPLKIEVHFRIAEPLPICAVDITAALARGESYRGLCDYPHVRELFRHFLLHAAGNMRAHALRQIQLHDIALLSARLGANDWSRLLDTPDSHGGSWWMWPVLELTRRYYPDMVPPVVERFRTVTPRWLRHVSHGMSLTDLSWSNLKIAAFPGIYWARSPAEALRFVRSRVVPDRAALEDLRLASQAQPAMASIPWYGISHPRRIFRWLFSPAPRVQTVLSVQSALALGEHA